MQSLQLVGVEREHSFDQFKSKEDQWIRTIYYFDDEVYNYFIVICCTLRQAQALVKATALEIDLSFKMVAGKVNLFSISGWDDDTQRMLAIYDAYAH